VFATSDPAALGRGPRAVAASTFDGIHRGHRTVIKRTQHAGLTSTVVTCDPHPRRVLGREVQLISSVQRRLELMADTGVQDVLVIPFTMALSPVDTPPVGRDHPAPHRDTAGDCRRELPLRPPCGGAARTLRRMGFDVDVVTINGGMSSTRIRGLVRSGEFDAAVRPLGRPCELEGTVLPGARPGRLSLATEPGGLLPPCGTYPGWAIGRRTLVTVGTAVGRIELQFPGPVPAAPSSRMRVKLIPERYRYGPRSCPSGRVLTGCCAPPI